MPQTISVDTSVNAPIEKAWAVYTEPQAIMKWNQAAPDWHCPSATNDLRAGGRFVSRMEAKDGSQGFDFGGTYDEVVPMQRIAYTMDDGRKAAVLFTDSGGKTHVHVTFEVEKVNPIHMQKSGWQSILDSYKAVAESA
jgi:uncharacterized protein YndB with AHSA1/START domain